MERIEDWYIYQEYSNFLKEIDFIFNEYNNKISILYKDPEEEAEEYTKYLYENPSEYFYIEDIEDVLIEIQELSFQRYLSIKNMKYRYLCMNIVTIYQMLEQFLSSIIKNRISLSMDRKMKTKYEKSNFYISDIKSFYKDEFNYNLENNKYYDLINELRLLENVIKHGEGNSAEQLKNINNKYFSKKGNSYPYNDTIIHDNLEVNDKDFERFYNAIKNFINEMPKHLQHKYRWEN